MKGKKEYPPVYYSEYLALDKILNAQDPVSAKYGVKADDEMLFIIVHQSYELWFKQILFELGLVHDIFSKPTLSDNDSDVYNVVHKLRRIGAILNLLVDQMGIIETMTPLDFLDFRDFLSPASGFQSIQFKQVEAILGLKYESRHGQSYYLSQLSEEDRNRVLEFEGKRSVIELLNDWLERMPFSVEEKYWKAYSEFPTHPFFNTYRKAYEDSLSPKEEGNLAHFDRVFYEGNQEDQKGSLSPAAKRNALFIMLYRDYPLLQLPFELLSQLLEVDHQLSMWRYRHVNMVKRMIGNRIGTGGSSGADYLKAAADKHNIFAELSLLTSFLMPRSELPALPKQLVDDLSFRHSE